MVIDKRRYVKKHFAWGILQKDITTKLEQYKMV